MMRKITIDGDELRTRDSVHQHLKTNLGFPDYYGMNLDALYDVLLTEDQETLISIINEDKLVSNIGEYWDRLIDTLKDISLHNNKITITIIPVVSEIGEAGQDIYESRRSNWSEKIKDPIRFQGSINHKNYFEGWYFKQVSLGSGKVISFIPGISLNKHDSHAFIQVIVSPPVETHYFRFDISDFFTSDLPFEVRIGNNVFSQKGIEISLSDKTIVLEGQLTYGPFKSIEKTILNPNAMGWFAYIPKMKCNHGIVSMDHSVDGVLKYNEESLSFNRDRGYIEKDWGSSFPERYIWMQGNHFEKNGGSFMCSIASIPMLGTSFTGLIANLVADGKEYRFATYNGAKIIQALSTTEGIDIILKKSNLTLEIKAHIESTGDLKSPIEGRMAGTIKEGLGGTISLVLKEEDRIIRQLFTKYSGIEVVGEWEPN
jgi:RNAse (barnase) inhibitor barstar